MLKMGLYLTAFAAVLVSASCGIAQAATEGILAGQDLHLSAEQMTIYSDPEVAAGEHVMLFENGFSMVIGANDYASDSAIVRVNTIVSEFKGRTSTDYSVKVYLQGGVDIKHGMGAKTTGAEDYFVENGRSFVARFLVTGQIYATADVQTVAPLSQLKEQQIYANASTAARPVSIGPNIAPGARIPGYVIGSGELSEKAYASGGGQTEIGGDFLQGEGPVIVDKTAGADRADTVIEKTPRFRYPVNISGLWESTPVLESTTTAEGNVATLIGRFYLWQKTDEKGGLLEFQADSAVMYYGDKKFGPQEKNDAEVLASGSLDSIYLRGNILMTEGERTIRADELYYNFDTKRGLAVKAEMRTFDEIRSIPVYIRADKLRTVSDNVFAASDVTVTTSEFYLPQISLTVSDMVLANTTVVDQVADAQAQQKFDAIMKDIRMNYGTRKIFAWPKLRTDFERPDLPIRSASLGNDSRFGTMLQTRWYLSKILGLKEAEGVDSTLLADYASKRGPGAGAVIDYEREDYYGGISAYIIDDKGEDDLGRNRKDIEPDKQTRGRFTARHRQYLPYDWQATFEVSYLSDKNFLESFYRSEYNTSKADETLIYLKRIRDNWAFSVLTKARINDFAQETEELPTAEYHLTGQSFLNNRFTFYNDTEIGRRRDLLPEGQSADFDESFYTFASSRNEVDLPLLLRTVKLVPYIAGTYVIDDLRGYTVDLDQNTQPRDKSSFLGEYGVRSSTVFWKDLDIESQFWDISGLRHTVMPHVELAAFEDNDDTVIMRDMVNFGLSQQWQTHRGPEEDRRTVNWMHLDLDATFVSNTANSSEGPADTYGPSKYIWNNQNIPLLTRRTAGWYGIVRDSFNADYEWQVSDSMYILSDMAWDIRSGVVQQFDFGISRYVFPDISYYVGNRYLRPVVITSDNETQQGSNALITAITYAMNTRYTATFAMEYNFDYAKTVRSELTFLRRYHRLYYGLTFTLDETLDSSSVLFSVWPQGVKDLALGSRKYTDLSDRVMAD